MGIFIPHLTCGHSPQVYGLSRFVPLDLLRWGFVSLNYYKRRRTIGVLKSRTFLFGLTMTVLFFAFFLYRSDPLSIGRVLIDANYLYVFPGILLSIFSLFWRTLRWQVVLRPLGEFRIIRLWPVIAVGYAANNLLPIRLGEFVRAYYVGRREGISKSSVLATILIERVFDGLALLSLVGVVSLFVPVVGLFQNLGAQISVNWLVLTLGLSVPFFVLTAVMIFIAVLPSEMERLALSLFRFLPTQIRSKTVNVIFRFLEGFNALKSWERIVGTFILSVPIWLCEASLFFAIAIGFGLQDIVQGLGFLAGILILTTATSNLGTSIPSTGGGVGPFEFFAQATLIFFGVGAATASAYVVVVHVALLVPVTLLGLFHIWLSDLSLGGLVRASQAVETNTELPDSTGSGQDRTT